MCRFRGIRKGYLDCNFFLNFKEGEVGWGFIVNLILYYIVKDFISDYYVFRKRGVVLCYWSIGDCGDGGT